MKRKAIFCGTALAVLVILVVGILLLSGAYGRWFSRDAAGLASVERVSGM
jgi:hypothetical protein